MEGLLPKTILFKECVMRNLVLSLSLFLFLVGCGAQSNSPTAPVTVTGSTPNYYTLLLVDTATSPNTVNVLNSGWGFPTGSSGTSIISYSATSTSPVTYGMEFYAAGGPATFSVFALKNGVVINGYGPLISPNSSTPVSINGNM